MRVVFAGTFYYFALLSARDSAHVRAVEFTRDYDGAIVTTAWILTELADGLSSPLNRGLFVEFLSALRADPQVTIALPDVALFDEGLTLYTNRPDKEWSLTDCISFCVMQRQGIMDPLTGDHHFEQAGFRALLK